VVGWLQFSWVNNVKGRSIVVGNFIIMCQAGRYKNGKPHPCSMFQPLQAPNPSAQKPWLLVLGTAGDKSQVTPRTVSLMN